MYPCGSNLKGNLEILGKYCRQTIYSYVQLYVHCTFYIRLVEKNEKLLVDDTLVHPHLKSITLRHEDAFCLLHAEQRGGFRLFDESVCLP